VVLGIVGRLVSEKGHARLIEAFARLAQSRQDVYLLVIGGGSESEQEQLTTLARDLGISGRVHFTGSQGNVRPYYQSLNLLVAPSTLEGLSNAVLEAMACGVPVLAHPATCGNSEVITHGQDGFLVELDTVEKLTRQLEKVLADPARLVLVGQAGREKVQQHFGLRTMIQNYQRLYQTMAGQGPS
jgi:glycosyltransferase involved in cell wall biosynthesis